MGDVEAVARSGAGWAGILIAVNASGRTKAQLRAAYRRLLPGERAAVPKRAFRAPVQSWLAGSLRACGGDPTGCRQVLDEL